jgi:hypothetical protein
MAGAELSGDTPNYAANRLASIPSDADGEAGFVWRMPLPSSPGVPPLLAEIDLRRRLDDRFWTVE